MPRAFLSEMPPWNICGLSPNVPEYSPEYSLQRDPTLALKLLAAASLVVNLLLVFLLFVR